MGASGAIIGAQAIMSVASAAGQSSAGRAQENVTKAEATISHAQKEFELARTAAVQSEEFRRNLASTIASASGRGGAGLARQFGGQAFASYGQDQAAIARAYRVNDIQKQNKLAQAASVKATTNLGALSGIGKDILGTLTPSIDLDTIFGNKKAKASAPTSDLAGTFSGKTFNPLG